MKDMRIGFRLICGFMAVSFVMLAIGVMGMQASMQFKRDMHEVGDVTLPFATNLGIMRSELNNIRAVQRTFLRQIWPKTSKKRTTETMSKAWDKYNAALQEIDALDLDRAEREQMAKARQLVEAWQRSNEEFLRFFGQGNYER